MVFENAKINHLQESMEGRLPSHKRPLLRDRQPASFAPYISEDALRIRDIIFGKYAIWDGVNFVSKVEHYYGTKKNQENWN